MIRFMPFSLFATSLLIITTQTVKASHLAFLSVEMPLTDMSTQMYSSATINQDYELFLGDYPVAQHSYVNEKQTTKDTQPVFWANTINHVSVSDKKQPALSLQTPKTSSQVELKAKIPEEKKKSQPQTSQRQRKSASRNSQAFFPEFSSKHYSYLSKNIANATSTLETEQIKKDNSFSKVQITEKTICKDENSSEPLTEYDVKKIQLAMELYSKNLFSKSQQSLLCALEANYLQTKLLKLMDGIIDCKSISTANIDVVSIENYPRIKQKLENFIKKHSTLSEYDSKPIGTEQLHPQEDPVIAEYRERSRRHWLLQ